MKVRRKMTGFGLIGTAAAWWNYRKAKQEYDELKEKQEGLQAVIRLYELTKKNEIYEELAKQIDEMPVEYMQGVQMTTILRVGNLVGKRFRAQASVVLTNTGDTEYYIHNVEAICYIHGRVASVFKLDVWSPSDVRVNYLSQAKKVGAYLKPGETMEIELAGGQCAFPKEEHEQLKDDICNAAGKRLITSCQFTNVDDVENADILVTWSDTKDSEQHKAYREKVPGLLRYCMEAFYPKG